MHSTTAKDAKQILRVRPTEAFVHTYNPDTDSWSAKSPMLQGREAHICVAMGDQFYLMGGRTDVEVLDLVEQYDPLVDTWVSRTRLPTARHWFSASIVGDRIFTFGGSSNGSDQLDVVEVLDTTLLTGIDSL